MVFHDRFLNRNIGILGETLVFSRNDIDKRIWGHVLVEYRENSGPLKML